MKTIEELKQEMFEAELVYMGKKEAYKEAKNKQKLDENGLDIGDIVESRGVIYKLSRTDDGYFYGQKKTKTGWHKSEQFIYKTPTKVSGMPSA